MDIAFTELVECPTCGEIFEGQFSDHTQSLTFQDMTEPPSGQQTCTGCDYSFAATMSGWMFYGEAG